MSRYHNPTILTKTILVTRFPFCISTFKYNIIGTRHTVLTERSESVNTLSRCWITVLNVISPSVPASALTRILK